MNPIEIRSRIIGHEEVAPDQLLAHELNFRRHPGTQLDALRGSLKELGWVKSVIVNLRTSKVIDGHARIEEAMRQGLATIPVEYVDLSPEEERLALAILDPITELAYRDQEALDALLTEVVTEDPGLKALLAEMSGEKASMSGLLPGVDEDSAPEPPAEPVTKPGDLYRLGEHRLLCGDATNLASVERLMDGGKADCVWTDPPYGVSYVGKTKDALTIENDGLDDERLDQLLRDAFGSAYAVSRDGSAWYVAAPPGPKFYCFAMPLRALGIWRQTLAWVKSTMVLGHSDYHYRHESLLYGWKPGAAHTWYSDRSQTTCIEIAKPNASPDHPTTKPVALVEYCLTNSSKPDDVVLDLFGGSGTTMIACEKLERVSRLMEIDPRYCDVIVRRWEEATGKKAEIENPGA